MRKEVIQLPKSIKCRILPLAILLSAFFICTSVAAQPAALDFALFDGLEHAITLNAEQHYLEAYRSIVSTDLEMTRAIGEQGVATLNDKDFELFYWPIKKTRAEVAYKLGMYGEMDRLSRELNEALAAHVELEPAKIEGMRGDLAKIDGSRHLLTRDLIKAEEELRQALKLKPYDHDFIIATRNDLAQLYYIRGDYGQALSQLDTLLLDPNFSNDSHFKASDGTRWDVESQRALCKARMGAFDEALDIIVPIVKQFKLSNDQRRYVEALRKQGKILMLEAHDKGSPNPEAQRCYRDYLDVMMDYIDNHFIDMEEDEREQFWMAEQPFITDCYALEDQDPEMLYDVALFSKAVLLQMGRDFKSSMSRAQRQEVLSSMRVKWHDVQGALPNDAAAIEFVAYQRGDIDHLGAIIVTPKATKPIFVPIGPASAILDRRLSTGSTVLEVISRRADAPGINALYTDSVLASIIWNEAMVKAIGNCQTIYFAADGFFHSLAIEYLLPPALSRTTLHRLTSTRLLTLPNETLNTDDMLLCGFVDYQKSSEITTHIDNDAIAYGIMTSPPGYWPELAYTLNEVDSIRSLRCNHPNDRVLLRDSVSETVVRQLMPRYHVVQIATHGNSPTDITAGNDLQPPLSDTQLSRSCLLLAGAERNMHQSDFDTSQPDGILSAREVAGMDLSNVQLVVLSACLTGRGEISTDGVYGLQRGMKTAGVHSLIVSLWEVNDATTNMLMTTLYRNLEKGMSLHEAFNKARESLQEYATTPRNIRGKIVSKKPFDKPEYYNAFILIDGL